MNEETKTHLTDESHIPVYTSSKEEYLVPDSRDNRDYLEPIMEKQIWDAIHDRDLQRLRSLLFEPQFPRYRESENGF